jgi:hypothetical protein
MQMLDEGEGGVVVEADSGDLIVAEWARAFFREISADSPALALLPLCDVVVVHQWVELVATCLDTVNPEAAREAAVAWTNENDVQVERSLPQLWLFLRQVLAEAAMQRHQARCRAACQLVRRLVQVCCLS